MGRPGFKRREKAQKNGWKRFGTSGMNEKQKPILLLLYWRGISLKEREKLGTMRLKRFDRALCFVANGKVVAVLIRSSHHKSYFK